MCSTSLTLGVGAAMMVAAAEVAVVEAAVWALAASVVAAAAAVVDCAVGRGNVHWTCAFRGLHMTPHAGCGAAAAGY